MEWISVKEKLPKKDDDVLIWDGDARSIGYFNGLFFIDFTIDQKSNYHVTHWMPLPEPPR